MSTVESDVIDQENPGSIAARLSRAPRISQADVFHAADELLVEGRRPTIDRVRMRLGRGSPNTINDHLDDWWAKLGSRLRDLPGQEFPHLPERVAHALQHLWNEALDGARGILQETLLAREQALTQREQVLEARARELTERDQAMTARTGAMEQGLALAREQLSASNQRAEALERTVQERDAECARLRSRIQGLESDCADGRAKLDGASNAHHRERVQMQERHAAAESHWLLEVDRSRQLAKETTRDHERQLKELRSQVTALHSERDHLRDQMLEARAELKTAAAVREQLEQRLRLMPVKANQPRTRGKRVRASKAKIG